MATIKQSTTYNEDDELLINIKQDNIDFSVSGADFVHTVKSKISVANSLTNGEDGTVFLPSVNAVDIDWNGAVLKIA